MNENEKCDRCPKKAVHAYVRVLPVTDAESSSEAVLAFCQDHSEEHGPALDEQGWRINVLEGATA